MKSPVFAALVLSASLAAVAPAQVKSEAAAKNPHAQQPANSQPTATIARARTVSDDSKTIAQNSAVAIRTPDAELNNHAAGARSRRTDAAVNSSADNTAKTNPV